MRARLARLRRFRPDPLTLDRRLAALLTVFAELQVWLGASAGQHRVAAALVAPALTASVAVRRRYPTLVGIGVPALTAFELALWGDPQIVANAVAYFCALYALAVWTPPRRFALGAALIVAVDLAASVGPKQNLRNTLPFAVVTPVVMLLVRRVVGDRERRAQLAERERDLAAREAVVEERARIARELHDAIAHDVSMMVIQAGAERRVLDGEARAAVHVRYGIDSFELEIVDDGAGDAAPISSGGHGLVGMRERAALFGGSFDAGRRPSGGFSVRVLLPIR